ncbi:helix-turn-helix domain-containing protein [Actinospica robiniae]|uniref:helix-turn-helix domain-containing protein n=1 Tax=Actinospica robiniae TaxID=304901 RepID=UPI0004041D84
MAAPTAVQFSSTIDLSDLAFLTVAEVATVLRVSKMTVYRMLRDETLEAVRVGRGYRIPAKAARALLTVEQDAPPS